MKLTCPKCNSNNTKVISVDDRTGSKEGDHIARYWRCLDCEEKYTTRERIEKPLKTNVFQQIGNHPIILVSIIFLIFDLALF